MEVVMSLNSLVRLPPLSNSRRSIEDLFMKRSSSSCSSSSTIGIDRRQHQRVVIKHNVIQAKQKKQMQARMIPQRRPSPPSLPKIEDDGNPKFVIFIRPANIGLWFPLSIVSGGTTAKIMVAAKDNFLGKYIYKDTIARNLAAVVYKDEKQIQETALEQHRALRVAKEFRYGYKLVQGTNLRSALSTSDVLELPLPTELKTVVDKVIDYFGDAKESFGKLLNLNSTTTEEPKEELKEEPKKTPRKTYRKTFGKSLNLDSTTTEEPKEELKEEPRKTSRKTPRNTPRNTPRVRGSR